MLMTSGSSAAPWNVKAAALALRGAQALSIFATPRVTVFCYHRISTEEGLFNGYQPNISASSDRFLRHLQLIKSLFTPISLTQLVNALDGQEPLPPRPALVTFDDGYRDNGTVAWPIMRDLGVPGAVFLATDHIGTTRPFIWDFAAYCIEHADEPRSGKEVELPLLGRTCLGTISARRHLTAKWVAETKTIPAEQRWPSAYSLATALQVDPPKSAFADLYMTWDDVRSLSAEGLEFGGHTRSHPILSRSAPEDAWEEIAGCQRALTEALGYPAMGFAYPNGSSKDFSAEHEKMILKAGFRVAFSLSTGSSRLSSLVQRPTSVSRLYVDSQDDLLRLSAKLARLTTISG